MSRKPPTPIMPPPAEPRIRSAAAGLSAQEAAAADPDYLYFLEHVHLDGDAYTLVIPSKDGGASQVITYEQPLPDHNAGSPVAGSDCGGQRGPPSSKESPRATREAAPRVVKRKAPDASPGDAVRSGAVPMEEDTPTPTPTPPVVETACYDAPDIDEDYTFFLRHCSVENDKLVFREGNRTITYEEDQSNAEEKDDTEEHEEDEEEEGEGEGEEEDEEEDDGLPASGQSGEDGIATEEAIPASEPKVKEEEVNIEEEDDAGPESDLQVVNDPICYETKKVNEGENTLNALARGTTDLDPLDKKEASSSKGRLATPINASELQGVIWPPHINERPNSVFKEKLIEFLNKPFTQEEYDRYLAMATDRAPIIKERRTRNKVAYYNWTHEMSKSYFDRYSDLAEQFSLQCNNYPNGLALLRGLFFWLQNIEQKDQFRPWSDAFKKYRVVPFVE